MADKKITRMAVKLNASDRGIFESFNVEVSDTKPLKADISQGHIFAFPTNGTDTDDETTGSFTSADTKPDASQVAENSGVVYPATDLLPSVDEIFG